jgi:hypothetical protein
MKDLLELINTMLKVGIKDEAIVRYLSTMFPDPEQQLAEIKEMYANNI